MFMRYLLWLWWTFKKYGVFYYIGVWQKYGWSLLCSTTVVYDNLTCAQDSLTNNFKLQSWGCSKIIYHGHSRFAWYKLYSYNRESAYISVISRLCAKKLSFLRLIVYRIMTFPYNSIVRNVCNSKFNKMYMELCRELSPFVGISMT